MADYGTRQPTEANNLPELETKVSTVFSYLVAGGEQNIYEYVTTDNNVRRFKLDLSFKNFTAGRVMTVRVWVLDVDGAYTLVDINNYTCNTVDEPNPYIEVEHYDDVLVTAEIDIVEAGNVDIERDIEVWTLE